MPSRLLALCAAAALVLAIFADPAHAAATVTNPGFESNGASQTPTGWSESGMTELLAKAPDLDAVFVGSDLMAAGALAVLRAHGRRVPEDVAVGGFDDSAVASSTHPPLTTVRQPLERVAEETVRMLLQSIDGAERPSSIVLPTELVIRDSA